MTPAGVGLVVLGGAAGTLARYGLVEAVKVVNPAPAGGGGAVVFPAGTLAVNLIGCFAIGYLATVLSTGVREEYRVGVLVGVLGGFTTFSSFAWETQGLWAAGRVVAAGVYVAVSVGAGLLLAWAGKRLAGG